jgi:hypothetical protein
MKVAGFSIAQAAIGISLVMVAVTFLFRWLGEPADARVVEMIFFVLNFLPAAGALVTLGLIAAVSIPRQSRGL